MSDADSSRRRVRTPDGSRLVLTNTEGVSRGVCWLRLFADVEAVRDGVDDGTAVGRFEQRPGFEDVERVIPDGSRGQFGVGGVDPVGDLCDDFGRDFERELDGIHVGHGKRKQARNAPKTGARGVVALCGGPTVGRGCSSRPRQQ